MEENLKVNFSGHEFSTPLVGTSGTVGYLEDFLELSFLKAWGGLTFKGTTLKLREGNPGVRICETEAGFINSIGLQNEGIDYLIEKALPKVGDIPVKKIVNLVAYSITDFVTLIKRLNNIPYCDILELNISCPNIDYGNKLFSTDKTLLKELLIECVKVKASKTLMVKLSPNVSSISEIAEICQENGADAVSLVNTFKGMKIDIYSRKPMIHNVIGGYSGPAIKPMALAMIHEVSKAVTIPILGMGGVSSAEDVIEFLLAGASLVGIGTTNLINPKEVKTIFKGLKRYLKTYHLSVKDLIKGMINH